MSDEHRLFLPAGHLWFLGKWLGHNELQAGALSVTARQPAQHTVPEPPFRSVLPCEKRTQALERTLGSKVTGG